MMILATIPLWLLAIFLFLMGCEALKTIVKEDFEHPKTAIQIALFVFCFIGSSGVGMFAAWVIA